MLSNAAVFKDLAGYFGVEQIDHLTPDQPQKICTALNAALQAIWATGPHWARQGRDSGMLLAPQTVSDLITTRGSKVIAGGGITPEMVGQSIVIAGEQQAALNELTSQTSLVNPCFHSSANASATVYGNVIVLPENVQAVAGRVILDGKWELDPAERNERDTSWSSWYWVNYDYGFRGAVGMIDNRSGRPAIYWLESMIFQTTGVRRQRLCVYPMPGHDHLIEYECTYAVPTLTLADVLPSDPGGDFEPGDGDTSFIPMPAGYHESILLPIARAELTALPNFQASKVSIVQAGAARAMAILESAVPQEQGGVDLRPLYGYR